MKRFLPALFFILSSSVTFSQTYGNEWINYDQQYLKFSVYNDGIYRIPYDALNTSLAGMGISLGDIDPRNFQLYNFGTEQYIFISGENDGSFDPSDFIEFYGKKNDGSFDANLFDDPAFQLHQYTSLISDTSTYFLTWNTSISNARMENLANDLIGLPPVQSYNIYHSLIIFGEPYTYVDFNAGPPHLELFSSKFGDGEGFTSPDYTLSTYNVTVTAPDIYSGSSFTPTFKTLAIGSNESNHHILISINGTTVTDTSFFGYKVNRYTYEEHDLLESNTVTFVSGPTSTDRQRYSYIDLTYPRLYRFDNLSKIKFELPAVIGATTYLELDEFDEKATDPLLYDLTAHKRMTGIVETDLSKFHLPYNASSSQIICSSQDATDISTINNLKPVSFINYHEAANQGNYLIISDASLFDDGTGVNRVQEYADYRSSITGGNYDVKIVDIEQLYNQFSYGIRKHPLSIRNFAMFAADSFAVNAQYIFLIGKAYTYNDIRYNGSWEYGLCKIPTFGHPGSDNLLLSRPGDVTPVIASGRLVATTGDDIRKYYEKVVEFEEQQAHTLQPIANKAWMKNILHFAGGLDEFEQTLFNNFLQQYQYRISDTLYGANVYQFNKLSTDPIYYSESDYIDSLINNGVSLITFFGHSSTGSFDFNIGEPDDFNNPGKYFMVFGNGCNTSAIHGHDLTLSEKYMFADHKASIAFLAASSFSIASSLHTYALEFYDELGKYNYHSSIGTIVKATADSLWPTINIFDEMAIEHATLQGDPALNLNNHPLPDYAIEAPYVFFEPDIVTAGVDTFFMNIVVTNLGMAIDTNYYVQVKRTKPNGITETFLERFDAPAFRDTVRVPFATDAIGGVGLNEFEIYIDNLNEIPEIDELNNILGNSLVIVSDDAIPIYPVEFSIMNHVPEYFAASTANVFASEKLYIVEVDTTENYNSPLHQITYITESGGVVKWNNPPVTYLNNIVYYWRISPDTSDGEDLLWRTSSFLYLPGEITGWNQSHYFQYLNDAYNNIELEPGRKFEFVPDVTTYKVTTGIANWYDVSSYINDELVGVGSCVNSGLVVFVVDPNSGEPWLSHEVGVSNTGPYGDYYCSGAPTQRILQFYTNTPEKRELLYQFMMSTVPDSAHFICYSNGYAQFDSWLNDTLTYGHSLYDAFTSYGAFDILSLQTYDYSRSYIFYAQKGNPATKYEEIGDIYGTKIEHEFIIVGNWYQGSVETPLIGPAFNWDKAQWSLFSNDPFAADINGIDLIGVDTNGVETVLLPNLVSGDTVIDFINAIQYPYLKLRLNTFDDTVRTPAQFNYWRVIYDPVPEAALNPNIQFSYTGDTVDAGENISLTIAVTNVSDYDMDSLLIDFYVIDQNHIRTNIPYARQDSLLSDESMISSISFNSMEIPAGKNTFAIEVNPANDQPEQYHFNNIGYLGLVNVADIRNPLLDVTFDDVHIFDGDIVSAKPAILIALKDENKYLALADTALLQISIKYPDETVHDFNYDGVTTKFYPADTSNIAINNTAHVEMFPVFDLDGIYELQIHGEDVAGNDAGDIDYRTTFEVINKSMISNVFNYPNPFTSQTRFVFTLTGSEVPDYFKIQIMTVSGKVVREIMRNELGEIHIGNNITEFIWDGTDAFGDQLANGLYLYRVVTKIKGRSLEKYETNTDQYFTSGFGKMYLAR